MTDGPDPSPADPAARAGLHVVALGSALVDVLAPASDADLEALALVKGSMALVDRGKSSALYERMVSAVEVSGGSAANTVAGIAALGGAAGLVCKVGDDTFGDVFVHDLEATGVRLGRMQRATAAAGGGATGHCLVFVTPDGQRTMATHLGVAATLRPDDVDEDLVSRAQVVYLEGYLWDLAPAKAALRRAIEVAHAGDGLVALTVSDPFCVERHRREFLDLLHDDVDVLFANEQEAISLFGTGSSGIGSSGTGSSGTGSFDAAVAAVGETGLLAALTRGAAGSVVVAAHGAVAVPAVPAEAVVDTTGAGDLYAAGFLHGLTHGLDPEACARLGAVCAAEVISHLGARPRGDLAELARAAGIAV